MLLCQKELHQRCWLLTLPKVSSRLLSRERKNQSSMQNFTSLSRLMIQCGLLRLITKETECSNLPWQRKIKWAGGTALSSVIPRLTLKRYPQKTLSYLTLMVKLAQPLRKWCMIKTKSKKDCQLLMNKKRNQSLRSLWQLTQKWISPRLSSTECKF